MFNYVIEAKRRGLSCGVPKDACGDDIELCATWDLCSRATETQGGQIIWSNNIGSIKYVTEAKRLRLGCGVVSLQSESLWSGLIDAIIQPYNKTCDRDPELCTVSELCQRTISFDTGGQKWTNENKYSAHVAYAKAKGISCGMSNEDFPKVAAKNPTEIPQNINVKKFPNRKALVIGNFEYAHANPLKNPENDAGAIAKKLSEIGFDVTLLMNLSGKSMMMNLSEYKTTLLNADISLIYFAGHGVELDKQNYLVPVDASLKNIELAKYEAVPLDRILPAGSGARELSIVLIDACRDNPFKGNLSTTRSGSRGLSIARMIDEPVDTIISYAAASGNVAEDGDGVNSPYAESIIEFIGKPDLEIGFLFRKLRDRVMEKTNGRQKPETLQQLSGEAIYLVSK